jgi:hypothetical protein
MSSAISCPLADTPLLAPPAPSPSAWLQPAHQQLSALECWLAAPATRQLPLHQVEAQQEQLGRELQRRLLQAHIQQRGQGDLGPALRVSVQNQSLLYSHRRLHTRQIRTIFGLIPITRLGYSRPGAASLHPLDATLQLPARSFSYEFQKRMVKAAVQGTFREASDRIADFTGTAIPLRSVEEVMQDAAQDFDAFYASRTLPPCSQTGSILVAAVDSKGIPLVKPTGTKRVFHLTKGQKANRKKMATVAAVFTRQPWVRTPQQVVESLFRTVSANPPDRSRAPHPEHKRVWASLSKGKSAVVAEVAAEILRRDPPNQKTHVALTDGERALQILVNDQLKVTLVLDLLHVLEKLWKAAYVFHAEGTPEAAYWVQVRTLKILQGGVSQVVQGLRQSSTKRRLSGVRAETLRLVTKYLYRNRQRMRYHEYLAAGWPIASGPVEGACKNLIKDRMERSGMRWTEAMAEVIVKLRAVYLSGDLNEYWLFHIQRDQERLHPPAQWTVVVK